MINTIGSNKTILNANSLSSAQEAQAQSLEQLSSGKRVNSAADDPAASAIINQFAAQIAGNGRAAQNLSDGISLAQTADGALSQLQDSNQQIRELAVQAGNGILNNQDRTAIQAQADALTQSNNDVLRNASFNGQPLFQGNSLTFQAGPNAGDQISVTLGNLGANGASNSVDLSSTGSVAAALDQIDQRIGTINDSRAALGALNNRFEAGINNLRTTAGNLAAASSRIGDTDYAAATAKLAQQQILSQAGLATQAQANASSRQVLTARHCRCNFPNGACHCWLTIWLGKSGPFCWQPYTPGVSAVHDRCSQKRQTCCRPAQGGAPA